jgi:uncharacterized protein
VGDVSGALADPLHLTRPRADQPLAVLLKLAGESCNINCHYCYEKRKPYASAQRLEPEALRRFLELLGTRPLLVELHGGEPLLIGRTRMRALLEVLREHAGQVSLAMQTNATLLDEKWIAFWQEEWPDLDLGLSLDGPPEINDRHRVDFRGEGSGNLVEDALHRLERAGFQVGVIAVVTHASLGRAPELVDYFAGFGSIRFLKFAPCFDYNVTTKRFPPGNRDALLALNASGTGRAGWATTPDEYAQFVIDAFEAWRQGAFKRFLLEPVSSLIQTLAGGEPAFCHFNANKCAHMLTLYPDGRVGSCDELRMPDAELGRLDALDDLDGVIAMSTNPVLAERLERLFDKCNQCDYRPSCRGGCLATRLAFEGTPEDDAYCDHRMRMIDHVSAAIGREPLLS